MPSDDTFKYIPFQSFEPLSQDYANPVQLATFLAKNSAIRVRGLTVLEQACYPTPPASPDLDEPVLALAPSPPRSGAIATVQLDDIADSDIEDVESERELDIDEGEPPEVHTAIRVQLGPIPIPIVLDTPHHLPQAATFRLRSPSSLLALNAGSRSLHFDFDQTILDSMPYSAAAAAIHGRRYTDEDAVEAIVSGDGSDKRPNSLHWSLRQKSNDRIGAIFVQPPTPERSEQPTTSNPASTSSQTSPAPQKTTVRVETVPVAQVPSPPNNASRTIPMPIQVLPEVRSPPRRTVPMAPDMPLPPKRGRRPRLFGFTEMPDSGSSASSSAANSRNPSPDRSGSPSLVSPSAPPGPASSFIPRRQPVRARSETHLPTIAATAGLGLPSTQIQPPRRRENGLKLDFTGIIPVSTAADAHSSVIPSPYSAKLIRKKSGEILKPALKYGGPLLANGTPMEGPQTDITPEFPASARFESKSCPTTPSCPKYVHFDAQLERVKLFLHDQKPQVVSRDGSPSEHWTASEGEEYPFPSTDEEREDQKILQIKLPNFPTFHAPDTDLYLESLFLDDDRKNLRGMILCKNLAYHKWVAVRFTFDFWQTTSEVTASHKDAVKGGKYDRFSFLIKLGDILPRIEEKTMFLAIRYHTDGREIWDSNGGQNYQVLFEKVRRLDPVAVPKRSSVSIQPGMGKAVGGRTSQWSVTGGNADDRLADLRAKLSRLTAEDMSTSPPERSPNRTTFGNSPNRRVAAVRQTADSPTASPQRGYSSLDTRSSDLPSAGGGLAARYDFGTALKTTRKTSPVPKHAELPDVQTGLLNYNKVNNGHAATEFYSPRFTSSKLPEPTSDTFYSPTGDIYESPATISTSQAPMTLEIPDVHVQGPSPPPTDDSTPKALPDTLQRPEMSRAASLPAVISPRNSPPSLDTSGNVTDSPGDSPKSPPEVALPMWSPVSLSEKRDDMSHASYSSFIEQFCWGGAGVPSPPKRAHSSSSLDMYFSNNGYAPGTRTPPNGAATPRPVSYPSMQSNGGTQSPGGSFYSSFSSTAKGVDENAAKNEGLHLELERSKSSPRFAAMKMGVDRMSPPVTCSM